MAKYRLLSSDELMLFEKEFVEYLVVNGILAEDWESLKTEEPEQAAKIVDLFSDVVFETIMRKVTDLEKYDAAVIQFIKCDSDKMQLIALKRQDSNLDLSTVDFERLQLDQVEIISGSKSYKDLREIELFKMIAAGYQTSDGKARKIIEHKLLKI